MFGHYAKTKLILSYAVTRHGKTRRNPREAKYIGAEESRQKKENIA